MKYNWKSIKHKEKLLNHDFYKIAITSFGQTLNDFIERQVIAIFACGVQKPFIYKYEIPIPVEIPRLNIQESY